MHSHVLLLPKRNVARAAHVVLDAELGVERVERLLADAAARRSDLPKTPRGTSPGVRLLLVYLGWNLALHRALVDDGVELDRANAAIADIGWESIEEVAEASWKSTSYLANTNDKRLRLTDRWLWGAVFKAPFKRTMRPDRGVIGFDVERCPFAEFFQQANSPQLTFHAACSLDYRMADLWQTSFDRTKTLGAGDELCDFTFGATPVHIS